MTTTSLRGRLLWYELMTSDREAAEVFYAPVIGWGVKRSANAGMPPYTEWLRPGGVPVGGAMVLPAELVAGGVPPHWGMYVGVDRVEDAAAHATRLGGGELSPVIDIPGVGRMQTLRDPQGAAFSVYEPSTPPTQPEAPAEMGEVSWIELYTTDNEAAMRFYGELCGWQPTEALDMDDAGVYRMFGRSSSHSLGGMMTKTPDMAQLPNAWLLYFRVDDIDAAAERVKAAGGQVLHGPMEVPGGGFIVQAMDPQGAMFALNETAE